VVALGGAAEGEPGLPKDVVVLAPIPRAIPTRTFLTSPELGPTSPKATTTCGGLEATPPASPADQLGGHVETQGHAKVIREAGITRSAGE
jgi:hypothetical protein